MYQNEILQETCHCYSLLEDHQLFLVTVKAGSINDGIRGKTTRHLADIAFSPT